MARWIRSSKYRNVHTTRDGLHFDSLKEARRYDELCLLQRAGEIRNLVADKSLLRFACVVNGLHVTDYECDFRYETKDGQVIIEDTKSRRHPHARIPTQKEVTLCVSGLDHHGGLRHREESVARVAGSSNGGLLVNIRNFFYVYIDYWDMSFRLCQSRMLSSDRGVAHLHDENVPGKSQGPLSLVSWHLGGFAPFFRGFAEWAPPPYPNPDYR